MAILKNSFLSFNITDVVMYPTCFSAYDDADINFSASVCPKSTLYPSMYMYSSFSTYFFRSYAVSARWVLLNFRRIFASSFSTRARSCSCVRVRDARDPRRQSARLSLALSPLDASPRVVSFDRMPSPVVVIPRARALAAPYYCSSARLARTPSSRAYHRETAPCRRARASRRVVECRSSR